MVTAIGRSVKSAGKLQPAAAAVAAAAEPRQKRVSTLYI